MLLSSSNRKYPPFPLFSYFSVVVCLRCLLHHILSLIVYTFRENRDFVFISIVKFMMSANSRIRFGLQIVFVCMYITPSHYHLCAYFIWRHWTYKMHVRYNLSSVWVRLSKFSELSIEQYVGLCVFTLTISFVMIERIYTLSYYHNQIGSMNYYPLFRVRSWNNGMRCMSFYILIQNVRRKSRINYSDVIMSAMASQITCILNVYLTVCSGVDQRTPNLCATGLCEGIPPVTGEFFSQRASNAEKVSIWWRLRV